MRADIKFIPIAMVLGVVALAQTVEPARAQSQRAAPVSRAQQEAACSGDATQFCGAEIPDEQRIAACLRANRARISEACRAILR